MSVVRRHGPVLGVAALGAVIGSTFPVGMILGQADLAGGLSAAVNDASWSVTLYNVGQIAGLPMTMTAAAAFGRGRTMALAGAGFALSSAAIALSPGLGVFLAARLLQGFFGGALPVLFMVMIMTSLPPGRSQAGGLSLFAIATSVGAGFAAGLSFLLLEAGGWRGLFWCQVAVGGLYAVLAARALPHERGDAIHLRQKDWPSYVFLSVGLGLLVVFLSEGERRYWFDTWWIAAALASGAAATALGVRALAQASRPLLKLSLLRRPSFLGALLLQALFRAGSLLTLSTIPQALIRLEAYGLEQIAGLLIPMATAAAAGALASHLLCGRGHSRAALAAGLFACAIAAGLCTGVSSSWAGENYRIAIVIAGLGQGLFSVAVMRFAVHGLAREDGPTCAVLFNFARLFGLVGGVALLARLTTFREALHAIRLAESLSPLAPERRAEIAAQLAPSLSPQVAGRVALGRLSAALTNQAYALTFADLFLVLAVLMTAAGLLVCLLPPLPRPSVAYISVSR
ncbi:MAG: MFS transporter [Brevundimonas aurantiaca]